jgi:hypothetical protein
MMNDREKSHSAIVAGKPTNNASATNANANGHPQSRNWRGIDGHAVPLLAVRPERGAAPTHWY